MAYKGSGTVGQVPIGVNTTTSATVGTSVDANFSFVGSSAGSGRFVLVSHSDNTNTGSDAIVETKAGGTSGGDAWFRSQVVGNGYWSFGTDNSDSSAFVISRSTNPGTNNIMHATVSGEINYPLQPAFSGYVPSALLNKTGDGTVYVIGTDTLTKIFDQGNDFTTLGVFTAPVTGRYYLEGVINFTGMAGGMGINDSYIFTSNRNYMAPYSNPNSTRDSSSRYGTCLSCLADMDVGDTASLRAVISGGGLAADIDGSANVLTGFSGYLCC